MLRMPCHDDSFYLLVILFIIESVRLLRNRLQALKTIHRVPSAINLTPILQLISGETYITIVDCADSCWCVLTPYSINH